MCLWVDQRWLSGARLHSVETGIFLAKPKHALGCTVAFWNDAAGGDGAKSAATPGTKAGLGCLSFLLFQCVWEVFGSGWESSAWRWMSSSRFHSEGKGEECFSCPLAGL